MRTVLGGIEAGGTKFVCVVGDESGRIHERVRFPTTTPEETLGETVKFFRAAEARHGQLAAIGVASFGPIDLHRSSPTFGWITSTPKPGWANVNIVGALKGAFNVPIDFDTDVNAAALGEWRWGAAQTLDTFIYLTIGTGIGGGGLVNRSLMHGLVHPEMGHVRIPHDTAADPFAGVCPFHGDCLEGLASGPAITARWRHEAATLPDDHPAWALEARYLALAIVNFVCTLSPQRVVIGGGVMSRTHLYPLIRRHLLDLLNNYVRAPRILERIDEYVVPPSLSNDVGVLGALALAGRTLAHSR
jgi:fructokinase